MDEEHNDHTMASQFSQFISAKPFGRLAVSSLKLFHDNALP
jgi:hypothetical protein